MPLADLSAVGSYGVRLEFTEQMEPSSLSGDGLPFVSLEDEIQANTFSLEGQQLRLKHGRIPYGAPLYLWELNRSGTTEVLYVGKTTKMSPQRRFESHAAVVKLLADHVNILGASVYFRLCSRLDLEYDFLGNARRHALEHFPPDQAGIIVSDVEAYLIYRLKPRYNTHWVSSEKTYTKPFTMAGARGVHLP